MDIREARPDIGDARLQTGAGEARPGSGEARPGSGEARPGSGEARPEDLLPAEVAAGLERLFGLFRSLAPPSGLSLTAAATLATLERSGPCRLTSLAAREGVTQPAMTQLVARLQDAGLVTRDPDPSDGRVVRVGITSEGQVTLARRRQARAERLGGLLDQLSPDHRAALAAALPAMDALASARRDDVPDVAHQNS